MPAGQSAPSLELGVTPLAEGEWREGCEQQILQRQEAIGNTGG